MSVVNRRRAIKSIVVVALALGAGCGGPKTSVTQVWKADIAPPPMKNVLVFGARMDETNRRVVEDAFSAQLRARGVAARPSYELFPGELPDRARAREVVKQNGMDSVLVTTLKSVREQSTYVPGTYQGGTTLWSGYGGGPAWGTWDPGNVVTDRMVRFETTLWNGRDDGQLIWAATTETTNPSSGQDFAKSLTKEVMGSLEKAGFVAKKE